MKNKECQDERTERKNFVAEDPFIDFVTKTLDELKVLFLEKHEQYGRWYDPLTNFRTGAAMVRPYDLGANDALAYTAMFNEALAYERKHIAHVINSGVQGVKVTESLKDIAVYSVIEMYIAKLFQEAYERDYQ